MVVMPGLVTNALVEMGDWEEEGVGEGALSTTPLVIAVPVEAVALEDVVMGVVVGIELGVEVGVGVGVEVPPIIGIGVSWLCVDIGFATVSGIFTLKGNQTKPRF